MGKESTTTSNPSSVIWENLESWVRTKIQEWLQGLLDGEVAEFLGRGRYERRRLVDAGPTYRNGRGKPRKLTLSCGTVTLRRQKLRGMEERFESRVLPAFKRRTEEVGGLLPELYLHGLALGDFDLALRGLLGEDAPLSPSTVSRLKDRWQTEFEQWSTRRLDELEVTYLWVDGVYVKAGLEKQKAALLVAVAGLADGRKVVVAVVPGHRESEASWSALLRDLKRRGVCAPKLVVGDGHLGIWAGLRNVYPEANEQRCWNHRIVNVLDRIPKKQQGQAALLLQAIPYAETRAEANRLKRKFQDWCEPHGFEDAAKVLDEDWDRMVTFYEFPQGHWRHLRTTNVVESPFAALRLRTDAAKRFKKVANATALIWKMLLVAEKNFRRLNAPDLVREVFLGAKFKDGVRVTSQKQEAAA